METSKGGSVLLSSGVDLRIVRLSAGEIVPFFGMNKPGKDQGFGEALNAVPSQLNSVYVRNTSVFCTVALIDSSSDESDEHSFASGIPKVLRSAVSVLVLVCLENRVLRC